MNVRTDESVTKRLYFLFLFGDQYLTPSIGVSHVFYVSQKVELVQGNPGSTEALFSRQGEFQQADDKGWNLITLRLFVILLHMYAHKHTQAYDKNYFNHMMRFCLKK